MKEINLNQTSRVADIASYIYVYILFLPSTWYTTEVKKIVLYGCHHETSGLIFILSRFNAWLALVKTGRAP